MLFNNLFSPVSVIVLPHQLPCPLHVLFMDFHYRSGHLSVLHSAESLDPCFQSTSYALIPQVLKDPLHFREIPLGTPVEFPPFGFISNKHGEKYQNSRQD